MTLATRRVLVKLGFSRSAVTTNAQKKQEPSSSHTFALRKFVEIQTHAGCHRHERSHDLKFFCFFFFFF